MLVCALVNIFGSRYLDLINKICISWTAASVVIIMVTILAMADVKRNGAFVFGHYDASESGWPSGWAFFVGLLQAAYTLTGYGMVSSRTILFGPGYCANGGVVVLIGRINV